MVRAKFRLDAITAQTFVFYPVCDDGIPENTRFAKYTPSGTFTMVVDNPEAQKQLQLGKFYYIDMTEVQNAQSV